jgi:hypothetical protein
MTLSIMTLSITINKTVTQHNDIQHNETKNDNNLTLILPLSLSVFNNRSHYAEYRYTEYRYV